MSLWLAIAVAIAIAFGLKLAGYLVPENLLAEPHVKRVTAALPIALQIGRASCRERVL